MKKKSPAGVFSHKIKTGFLSKNYLNIFQLKEAFYTLGSKL